MFTVYQKGAYSVIFSETGLLYAELWHPSRTEDVSYCYLDMIDAFRVLMVIVLV